MRRADGSVPPVGYDTGRMAADNGSSAGGAASGAAGRYHRQELLPWVGEAGQARLAGSRVLLVGCGALGTTAAEQLARAGVGSITVADRDVVEWTNLQRQTLFAERDVGRPKAVAAAERLGAVNSSVRVDARVADVDADGVEALALEPRPADVIVDGTDNAQTRYLLNDVAVKHGVPWVYGGCVGTDGRVMAVVPGLGETPCLRCVFPDPPAAGELATCDTAGVLGPAASAVASLQAVAALKILTGHAADAAGSLLTIDFWRGRHRAIDLTNARRPDCPCCGLRRFDFLDAPPDRRRPAVRARRGAGPPPAWVGQALARRRRGEAVARRRRPPPAPPAPLRPVRPPRGPPRVAHPVRRRPADRPRQRRPGRGAVDLRPVRRGVIGRRPA